MKIFISDLHLGSDFIDIELLRSFLKLVVPNNEIYLIGDTFDFWKSVDGASLIPSLIPPTSTHKFLIGNHDKELSALMSLCPFIEHELIIDVDGIRILIEHGDDFDGKYGTVNSLNRFFDSLLYKLSKFLGFDIRIKFHKFVELYYKYVSNYLTLASTKMHANYCSILIFGHTHVPGVFKHDGCTMFNLGSWYRNPHALFLKGDQYAFHKIRKDVLLPKEEDFNHIRRC